MKLHHEDPLDANLAARHTAARAKMLNDHDDAALIALCGEHIGNLQALLESDPDVELPDNPVWGNYKRTLEVVTGMRPQTMAGVLAKARAAAAEMDVEGTFESLDGMLGGWAWHIVTDLLRLEGRAQI